MTFEVKTELTKRDIIEFQLFHRLRSRKARYRHLVCAFTPPLALVALAAGLVAVLAPGAISRATTLVPLALIPPLYLLLFYHVTRRRLQQKLDGVAEKAGMATGAYAITITLEGVTVVREATETFIRWTEIPRVVANKNYGYIYTGPDEAIIIPQHCFESDAAFGLFVKSAIIFHWNNEGAAAPKAVKNATAEDSAATPALIPLKMPTSV